MRGTICGRVFLACACLLFGGRLWGQQDAGQSLTSPSMEVAVVYNSLLTNVVRADRFWMQGGGIQVDGQFWRGLGVEADISGFHAQNANNAGVGLDMVTATFGPRYAWSPANHRYALFGHALAGVANGFDSVFPGAGAASGSATSLAVQIGGGIDLRVKHRLLLRVVEADWLRTQLPNADTNVQNSIRLAAGVVVRFR
ncbi:MAG: hypothetical protein WA510_07000 [Acidobacteriaceae bacterium]